METNPYQYNTTVPWIPQQNQIYESTSVAARIGQQRPPLPQNQGLAQKSVGQKLKPPEKMPKARALALARMLKRWFAIASLVGFGTFGGLVAFHQVGTTTATQTNNSSSGSSQSTSATNSSSQNNNSFLNQGGNNFGSSSGSSSSSQAPASGSSVS